MEQKDAHSIEKNNLKAYLNKNIEDESELIGIECEAEDPELFANEAPYDVKNIRVTQKMITIFQFEHWINQGMLKLSPDYQRNLVWDLQRKSALIESLLLGIPIPAFYLDENVEGKKSVIDGLQRLSTIHDFLNDQFALTRMEYLTGCEKKYFSQLEIKFRSRIEDTELAVNILDVRCPEMVKFDVFRRVNTGGLPLNPQEIRNIMAKPAVRELLKTMAECEAFLLATGGKINDVRMGAQELCLRYLTIERCWRNGLDSYHGLLKSMDAMVVELNGMSREKLEQIVARFIIVMEQCAIILGELSFCKPGNRKVNKSLFTSWATLLTVREERTEVIQKNSEKIRSLYLRELTSNTSFYNAITSSTGVKRNIWISLNVIRQVLEACL